MGLSPVIRALKWPLAVLALLLGLLLWTLTVPSGGHPEGSGLALYIYITVFLPGLSLLGLPLSIWAWVRNPAFRAPALLLCLAYGAGIAYPGAIALKLAHYPFY